MNFIEQASRNKSLSPSKGETEGVNYYALFDKPVPENLAANRSGILSPQQRSALEQGVANHKSSVALVIVMLMCIAFGVFFFFWRVDSDDGVLSLTNLAISGGVITLLLGGLAAYWTGDWFVFFARDDLESGVVESAAGKVVWNGKHYQMRTDSRQLRSLRYGIVPPPPGEYRFYYLPHTGLVVMAEEARNANADETSSTLFQALASANYFSLQDLKVNQQGMLSKRQENGLLLIVALYLVSCMSLAALFTVLIPQILQAVSATLYILILIIGAILLLKFSWSAIQIMGDIWIGKPSRVEGPVVRQSRRTRYYRSHYYVSGSHKFQVSESAYNALIEGKSYRIFYVPRSKRLVSMEPIGTSTVMDGMN